VNKGFLYTLSREKLIEYRKLSVEEKLTWLEEIFLFSELAMPPKAKKIRAYLKGETPPHPATAT
jgi:hypothetical protein